MLNDYLTSKYSLQVLCSVVEVLCVASHVIFDKDCRHAANGDSLPRCSLAAGDLGGDGLQIIIVASLVFLVRAVVFLIPGTLIAGIVV
jgi:hypothetical protein